jgi:hypothetical protein
MSVSKILLSIPFPTIPSDLSDNQQNFYKGLRDYLQMISRIFTKENIEAGVGTKTLTKWINVTGNETKAYISSSDWRGRFITAYGAYKTGDVASSLSVRASDGSDSGFEFFGGSFTGSDYTLLTLNTNFTVGIEIDSGKIFWSMSSFSSDFQCFIFLSASDRLITNTD